MTWLPAVGFSTGSSQRCMNRGAVPSVRRAVLAGGLRGVDKDYALARAGIDRPVYFAVSIELVLEKPASRRRWSAAR